MSVTQEGDVKRPILAVAAVLGSLSLTVAPSRAAAGQGQTLADLFKTGTVRFVPEMTITDEAMAGKAFFSQISDIAMDDKGNLYAADSKENNIKMFDRSGAFLGTIGRAGQGPGEFNYPIEIEFSKGRLYVRELFNSRVSILDDKGIYLNSVRIERQAGQWWNMLALPDGRFVVQREVTDFQDPNAPQEVFIDLFSSELAFIKTLYRHVVRRNKYISEPVRTNVPVPFAAQVYCDVTSDGRVLIAYSGGYEVEVHDPDKGKVASFTQSYTPAEVTAEDKELYFKGMVSSLSGPSGTVVKKQGAPDYIINNTEFPRTKPPFLNIKSDLEGNVWVQLYGPTITKDGPEMDVFDRQGRYCARVRIQPGGVFPYRMVPVPGGFWTIRYNEEGEVDLVRFRVSR
jgi:6-bladed beta-propeller